MKKLLIIAALLCGIQNAGAAKASQPVPIAVFKNKWCQSIDKSTTSPFEYRGLRTGDGCLLPDEVIVKVINQLELLQIDVMNIQAKHSVTALLINFEVGEFKFPHMQIFFSLKDNKFYVVNIRALICPTSELNSLADSNSFRVALEGKYGKPSSVVTEGGVLKAQVDSTKRMIADQRRQVITVGEAKSARESEYIVNMLSDTVNRVNRVASKIPLQLHWEYDSKNKITDESYKTASKQASDLSVTMVKNDDVSFTTLRCEGDISRKFAIQIAPTSSMYSIVIRHDNELLLNEANKEKNAPTPKL